MTQRAGLELEPAQDACSRFLIYGARLPCRVRAEAGRAAIGQSAEHIGWRPRCVELAALLESEASEEVHVRVDQLATQLRNVGMDEQEMELATSIELCMRDVTRAWNTLVETSGATAGLVERAKGRLHDFRRAVSSHRRSHRCPWKVTFAGIGQHLSNSWRGDEIRAQFRPELVNRWANLARNWQSSTTFGESSAESGPSRPNATLWPIWSNYWPDSTNVVDLGRRLSNSTKFGPILRFLAVPSQV